MNKMAHIKTALTAYLDNTPDRDEIVTAAERMYRANPNRCDGYSLARLAHVARHGLPNTDRTYQVTDAPDLRRVQYVAKLTEF